MKRVPNLTTSEVCEVSGMPAHVLRRWIDAGVILPARSLGVGRGNGYEFTALAAVAVTYAHAFRTAGWGGGVPELLARWVLRLGMDRLEAEVAAGRTMLWPPSGPTDAPLTTAPPVDPATGAAVAGGLPCDLGACLRRVREKVLAKAAAGSPDREPSEVSV